MKTGNSIHRDCSRRRNQCVGSVDRICDLPDSILAHILSFLPTENAFATCILSHRWKFLWTMTDNLNFCYSYDYDGKTDQFVKKDQFVKFVNYVFLLHKPGYLNRFTLLWFNESIPYYINAWISAAISRGVRELFVSRVYEFPIHLQRSMFGCESLQSLYLELKGNYCISNEIVVSLPKLESLKLKSVSFQSEETLCKLLGGCPLLKYCILKVDNDNGFKCIISSNSLRRLELYGNKSGCCIVQLEAPLLQYIRLRSISSICNNQSLISLVKANIELCLEPVLKDQNYFNCVAKSFQVFVCAKKLILSPQVISDLGCATTKMKPRFNFLRRLEVTRLLNLSALRMFMTLADSLEVLIINKDYDDCTIEDYFGSKTDLVPKCLLNSLRTVSISYYDGREEEIEIVDYILKYGSVLELMEITLEEDGDFESKYKMVQEISELVRKSSLCKVKFKFED